MPMTKAGFEFLVETRARKLVAAWRSLPPRAMELEALLSLWSAAAGVEKSAARRLLPVLTLNEIITQDEDGLRKVDEMAEQVLFSEAVGKLNGFKP